MQASASRREALVKPPMWFVRYRNHVVFLFHLARPSWSGEPLWSSAALLEGLQAFTPDLTAYLPAAIRRGDAIARSFIPEISPACWEGRGAADGYAVWCAPLIMPKDTISPNDMLLSLNRFMSADNIAEFW